jgi:hypothetical protein
MRGMWTLFQIRPKAEQLAAALVLGLVALYIAVAVAATETYLIFGCALSPDGRFFIHDSTRGCVLFDTHSAKELLRLGRGRYVFSPSSKRLAVCRGRWARIWELTPRRYLFALDLGDEDGKVWHAAFLDDDTLAVVKPRQVEQWSLPARKRLRTRAISSGIPDGSSPKVALSLDGHRVAIGDDSLEQRRGGAGEWRYRFDVWELDGQQRRRELARDRPGTISNVLLSNDGRLLAADVGNDRDPYDALRVWDLGPCGRSVCPAGRLQSPFPATSVVREHSQLTPESGVRRDIQELPCEHAERFWSSVLASTPAGRGPPSASLNCSSSKRSSPYSRPSCSRSLIPPAKRHNNMGGRPTRHPASRFRMS